MISRNGHEFEWVGGFSAVKELWDSIAIDVMDTTKDACQQAGYVLNALGKSRSHWENVQRIVQIKLQDQELEKMRAALKDR